MSSFCGLLNALYIVFARQPIILYIINNGASLSLLKTSKVVQQFGNINFDIISRHLSGNLDGKSDRHCRNETDTHSVWRYDFLRRISCNSGSGVCLPSEYGMKMGGVVELDEWLREAILNRVGKDAPPSGLVNVGGVA